MNTLESYRFTGNPNLAPGGTGDPDVDFIGRGRRRFHPDDSNEIPRRKELTDGQRDKIANDFLDSVGLEIVRDFDAAGSDEEFAKGMQGWREAWVKFRDEQGRKIGGGL